MCFTFLFFLNAVWFYKQYFSTPTHGNQTKSSPPFPSVISSLVIPSVTFEARVGRQSKCQSATSTTVSSCWNLRRGGNLSLLCKSATDSVTSHERYFTLRKITAWLSENSTSVSCQPLSSFTGRSSALFCELCWKPWATPRSLWFWWMSQTSPPNR